MSLNDLIRSRVRRYAHMIARTGVVGVRSDLCFVSIINSRYSKELFFLDYWVVALSLSNSYIKVKIEWGIFRFDPFET